MRGQGKIGRVMTEQDPDTGALRFSYLVKSDQLAQRMSAPHRRGARPSEARARGQPSGGLCHSQRPGEQSSRALAGAWLSRVCRGVTVHGRWGPEDAADGGGVGQRRAPKGRVPQRPAYRR